MSPFPSDTPSPARWLPGLAILKDYRLAWLPRDAMAGIVLVTMLVPVGIACAVASGLPVVYGLYATIVPLLAHAVFGRSRILVLGRDSSLAPVILAVVVAHAAADPGRVVAIAGAMAVVSGSVCILAGALKLGFVTPMDLAFPGGLVLITGQVAGDGRSDWLKGAQLLAVYVVLGLTVFFLGL